MMRFPGLSTLGYCRQVRELLERPESVALLEAAPGLRSRLRPVCRLFGVPALGVPPMKPRPVVPFPKSLEPMKGWAEWRRAHPRAILPAPNAYLIAPKHWYIPLPGFSFSKS
jgi:hypothetical protein